jgi:hypothetical protein
LRRRQRLRTQGRAVGGGHVHETLVTGFVEQRRTLHHVEVVVDQHQRARSHAGVHAAGGVGLHQHLHTGGGQRADGAFHAVGFSAFIGVFAAGQHQHFGAADSPGTQQPCMAANGQCGKGRQLGVTHIHRVGHDIGKRPPARPQQHGDAWRARAQPGAQRGCALFNEIGRHASRVSGPKLWGSSSPSV